MKKINLMMVGAAGLLLASCANDADLQGPASGDGNVTITVSLPELTPNTRADFGTGMSSKVLQYAVYYADADGNPTELAFADQAAFGNSTTTTLSLNLLNKQYVIAFFAQSGASATEKSYVFDADEKTINVDYSKMTSGTNLADGYDCFYNTEVVDLTSDGSTTPSASFDVKLYRPVAQINWGANDIDATDEITSIYGAGGENIMTQLTVDESSKLATSLNVFTGVVEKDFYGVIGGENPNFAKPASEYVYPVAYPTNQYIALQYVLVGVPQVISGDATTASVYEVVLDINNGANGTSTYNNAVEVLNMPLQPNYQTNIYGALLSNNVSFNIEVMPGFAGTYNEPLAWDGTTVTYPSVSADGNTYTASKASDLAGIIDMVNGTNGQTKETFEGKTIVLASDLDMGGHNFEGIGQASRSSSSASGNAFMGVFDGQGNTISNIQISNSDASGNSSVGFIGNLAGSTAALKDVTFENIEIAGGAAEQAGIVGLVTDGATVSGVTISSGSISATEGAGLVGRVLKSGTVTNCENHADITVTAKNGAGIAGAAYYSVTGKCDITISNCKNYGNIKATGTGAETLGGIVGTCAANVIGCTNYGNVGADNTTSTVGGIVGYQVSCGSIKNCENNGTVNGTTYVGGILGWIGGSTYDYQEPIYLTDNTNNGALDGTGNVGGILAINRNGGYLEGNVNNAPSMKGGTVAGIISNAGQYGTQAGGYIYLVSGNVNNTSLDAMTATSKKAEIFTGTLYVGNELETN